LGLKCRTKQYTSSIESFDNKWIRDKWFVSPEIEKTPEQKAVLPYLAVGAEESFTFQGVANIYASTVETEPKMPDQPEIRIESFETVQ